MISIVRDLNSVQTQSRRELCKLPRLIQFLLSATASQDEWGASLAVTMTWSPFLGGGTFVHVCYATNTSFSLFILLLVTFFKSTESEPLNSIWWKLSCCGCGPSPGLSFDYFLGRLLWSYWNRESKLMINTWWLYYIIIK